MAKIEAEGLVPMDVGFLSPTEQEEMRKMTEKMLGVPAEVTQQNAEGQTDAAEEEDGGESEEEYVVERILEEREDDHGGKEYLVKWVGFEDEVDRTWEPKSSLDETEALDTWLKQHGESSTRKRKAEDDAEDFDEEEEVHL